MSRREALPTSVETLPTARTSYFTVAKLGGAFAVQLVTPGNRDLGVEDIKTTLARISDAAAAVAYATDHARRQQLPVRLPTWATAGTPSSAR